MSTNNNNQNNNNNDDDGKKRIQWIAIIIFVIWIGLGVGAYIYSFNCTSDIYAGGDARKITMFLLALFFGPFWWLILPFAKSEGYCRIKKT